MASRSIVPMLTLTVNFNILLGLQSNCLLMVISINMEDKHGLQVLETRGYEQVSTCGVIKGLKGHVLQLRVNEKPTDHSHVMMFNLCS